MAGSILFSTSYICAIENKLLSTEKYSRMLESSSAEEALKVLYEVPYASGQSCQTPFDYEKLLIEEELSLSKLIKELAVSEEIKKILTLNNDYHNMKVLIKSKYTSLSSYKELINPCGSLDIDFLEDCVTNESYIYLSDSMKKGIKSIEKISIGGKIKSQEIDLILDKAYSEELFELLKKSSSKSLKKYYKMQIDLSNILTIIRLKKLEITTNTAEFLIEGGELKTQAVEKLVEKSDDNIIDYFKYTDYNKFVKAVLENSYFEYEKMMDNMLLDIFKKQKNNAFSINPIIGYYFGKKAELKNVRIIMTGILSNLEKSKIKERLRESYV